MFARLLLHGRTVLGACAVASACGCTFPDVDYASDARTTSECSAPPTCAADAMTCADKARKAQDMCSKKCNKDTGCLAGCDGDLGVALGQCNAVCQSCSSDQGCTDATASCKALVGG